MAGKKDREKKDAISNQGGDSGKGNGAESGEYDWQNPESSSSFTGSKDEADTRGKKAEVTSIIQDGVAVGERVKILTSAKSVTRSDDAIPSNGVVSIPKGVCALLFNMYSEGPAEIHTRSEIIRTGPEHRGWYIIDVDEGDYIWGFVQFYYYWDASEPSTQLPFE